MFMLQSVQSEEAVDAIIAGSRADDHVFEILPTVKEVTGSPPRRLLEWVEANKDLFQINSRDRAEQYHSALD